VARYNDPSEYYRTLGVRPGASQNELRRAYLALVKLWHPDRFPHNSPAQILAQEKLKAINEAYTFLREYDPSQPQPDLREPQPPRPPRGATAQWQAYQRSQNYRPPVRDPYAGDYQYRPVGESRGNRFIWILASIMIGNLATLMGGGYSDRNTPATSVAAQVSQAQTETMVDQTVSAQPARQESPYFFVGSSKGDVYRIQGMPDWADDQEWQYGDSRVYFRGQIVESWESKSVPLKAVALTDPDPLQLIHEGSSTKDVLAIQGAPTAVHDGYWQYGESRINFSEGRVTGWKESPLSPLKVRHFRNM
jgi:DnaJ-like protein